jgi:hypothetical protein
MNGNKSFAGERLSRLIGVIQRNYPGFMREGARAAIFFTAFFCGSLSSLFFDISPAWAWLPWLIAAFVTHILCEQLYRRYVFAWYESQLRFFEEEDEM